MSNRYQYKMADQEWEFDLISKLNYKTFVEEIPQHETNQSRELIDTFHKENKYFICLRGAELAGMMAIRDKRPFSLDKKLGDVNKYFPPEAKLIETRLLSVESKLRTGIITANLMAIVADFAVKGGYDAMIISATTLQLKLYEKLGFMPFGPLVGSVNAEFQPMYITHERFRLNTPDVVKDKIEPLAEGKLINFLPGPVEQHSSVKEGLNYPVISHRSFDYKMLLKRVHWQLCRLSRAKFVQIYTGTGTLANDAVAAQLLQLQQKGLIISNGEFGDRLIKAAEGFNLKFDVIKVEWGEEFDFTFISKFVQNNSDIKWLWLTHLETSTGILNNLGKIKKIALKPKLKVCVDCISSFGNTHVDLSWTYLATCVSGKGLAAHTGLSFVFYNHLINKANIKIPRYIDLYNYQKCDGVPYSGSSNLLHSLFRALENIDLSSKIKKIKTTFASAKSLLKEYGLETSGTSNSNEIILNIIIPKEFSSMEIGKRLERDGYLLHFRSQYLREGNVIQICFMSDSSGSYFKSMLNQLKQIFNEKCSSKNMAEAA